MDVGSVATESPEITTAVSPRLIWLVGALAVCRSLFATLFPTVRRIFNL
jgi:ABC-type lipoprotein release transport system permease subunit